jgi:hypothetical protein
MIFHCLPLPARINWFMPKAKNWRTEWREQCRRQMARDILTRLRYGFVRTYKPVLDDAPYRIFDTMADYRQWCEEKLPKYLGYHQAHARSQS